MRFHPTAGQASTEYVALLLVLTMLAGGAATAVAAPGLGERLVRTVRTGLCVVGGDVCRTADAAAAGLPPCVTAERSSRQDTTVDIAIVRLGGHGEWQLALQSDGEAVVTRLAEDEVGASAGVGVTFSPAGIDATATATATLGYRGGRSWRFPDAGRARAFLDAAMHDAAVQAARPPDERWDAIRGGADAVAGAAIEDLASAGIAASADGAIGLRRAGARRTLTIALGAAEPELALRLTGFPAATAGGGARRSLVADVTWEAGAARELALRSATARDGRVEEITARLDLGDPESRALAARLLHPGGHTADDVRALAVRLARYGVVERDGYAVAERRRGFSVAGRLGVSLGLSHARIVAERRLVDAVAWVRGGPPRRRFDCLGT